MTKVFYQDGGGSVIYSNDVDIFKCNDTGLFNDYSSESYDELFAQKNGLAGGVVAVRRRCS